MIIRKTVKQYYRDRFKNNKKDTPAFDTIVRDTYWFLFIPIYTVEHLVQHFV